MNKTLSDKELQIEAFGQYLLERRLVREHHAPYYVRWVQMFLTSPIPAGVGGLDDRLRRWLEELSAQGREDWQVRQAEQAVRLYHMGFLDRATEPTPAFVLKADAEGRLAPGEALTAVRELLRTRHYSYRTEQTYAHWIAGERARTHMPPPAWCASRHRARSRSSKRIGCL